MIRSSCLFVLFLLTLSLTASAQQATASLRGVITDQAAAHVSNANVEISNGETGFHRTTVSDRTGAYSFEQLPPGKCTVVLRATGFSVQTTNAELIVDQPATLNFTLSIQQETTTVSVSAETQTLNTTDASLGNAINNATIEALPMEGRNVPDLLSLQPGVLYLGHNVNQNFDSRSGAVAGARSDQGNLTLDGIDNNEQVSGFAFTGVLRSTLDSVEDFRVTTTNSNADAGRSSGAQVSVVTRSGTNHLHGSLYEYNRNTLTAANNWFNKQAELAAGEPNTPGKLIRNTYGASLGGPLKQDKLFYFVNYEGQRTAENQQETLTVPTQSMRAGNVVYPHTDSTGQTSQITLTPAQIATMDLNCTGNGTCPLGPGVNPASLALFQTYPLPNGFVAGDAFNTGSYTWSAPNPLNLSTYIAKADWIPDQRHHIFARGNLQNDNQAYVPQFPGEPASNVHTDNSKGIAAGDTWTIGANLINNARYSFIRQGYADRGAGQGYYITIVGLSNPVAENRNTLVNVPVHNVIDDLTWIHHHHTFQFGANYRLIHNNLQTDANSYSTSTMNMGWLLDNNLSVDAGSFNPSNFGYPSVDSTFGVSYGNTVTALAGLLPLTTAEYNYKIANKEGTNGTLVPAGSLIGHSYKSNEFEYYLLDSWRATSNLTLTFGIRHTLLQTPYEANGQQVQPNLDVHNWFLTRGSQAAMGNSVQPEFTFSPSGQARGGKAYWPMQKNNIAPRFAIAYAPAASSGFLHTLFGDPGKSSIRAGFGMYYDHFGQGVVNSFSQYGAYGLSGSTPTTGFSADTTPRFTGLHNIPDVVTIPPTVTYPYKPSDDPFTTGLAFTWGLDDHMKTPYSYAMNLSVQRELPGGFMLETSYVGRIGRHLLQQIDLGEFTDLVDPKSGVDYFTAASQLSQASFRGDTTVPDNAYWEDLFPDAAGGDAVGDGAQGNSATTNIYNDLWKNNPINSTLNLFFMDIYCDPGCGGQTGRYTALQWGSLYAWSSIGSSYYNAGQITLRHPMSHGLQMDFSYTLSKSLDMGSDAERACVQCGTTAISSFGAIINSWNPRLNYGVSDFDTRHLITSDWVYLLPFGRGQRFANNSGGWLDALVGRWQLSGLARWTSGLPFSLLAGQGWQTNFGQESALVQTGPVKTHRHLNANGSPEVFADPDGLLSGLSKESPLRNPLPGEAGERNQFRGDGFFGIDSGLSKSWTVHKEHALKFSWEVFNVTNSVRFDVNPLNSLQNQTNSGEFGVYGATLTQPRVQQFSLRYAF